ncbi:MAG: UDP-N-acetylmuramate dehydrogenase [Fimbriimonadaceae bacterium]|nr:UDP-N-acetylmuramate dehydrogenase [Fimbriimonadaceae bacterium]
MASNAIEIHEQYDLKLLTTLKAGGRASKLCFARSRDSLAEVSKFAYQTGLKHTILGWGSNVLPSDKGVPGLVTVNLATQIQISPDGTVVADCGAGLQELFLKTAQAGLEGLSFAVGIPGTVGGALVSNAGAYRSNVSRYLAEIEVVRDGVREWLTPEFMQFSYRDSILRQINPPSITLLAVKLKFDRADAKQIYDDAREFQRQRIGKQPPSASAGSFFKNVNDAKLAASLPSLPLPLKDAGVVPAGYLIEQCGLKGKRFGGAMVGARHANFVLNVGGATASEIRRLAEYVNAQVHKKFGVWLEEEALYLGDWSDWETTGELTE